LSFDDSSQTRPLRLHGDSLKPLTATFCREKISGHGEDAEPVNVELPTYFDCAGAFAVFDGLGGAGCDRYTYEQNQELTGAKISADLSAKAFTEFARNIRLDQGSNVFDTFVTRLEILRYHINAKIDEAHRTYPSQPSQLRSAMRRVLPTTCASAIYISSVDGCRLHVIWAGDSRVYALSPFGLQVLTHDDIQGNQAILDKPMHMVDAPITNCIEYSKNDKKYTLNYRHYNFKLPVILIAATDGCFGYLKTPAHFEHLLLDELQSSQSMEDWRDRTADAIGQYAQDDYSMSITCCGWSKFRDVQAAFSARYTHLDMMIERYTADANAVSNFPEWNEYSTHYIARLKETSHGN
jgi:serine/threonine protein phosphatase PrpC